MPSADYTGNIFFTTSVSSTAAYFTTDTTDTTTYTLCSSTVGSAPFIYTCSAVTGSHAFARSRPNEMHEGARPASRETIPQPQVPDAPPERTERLQGRELLESRANMRARRLLLRHLDPVQRKQYRKECSFIVQAPSGNRYHIKRGRAGNVYQIEAGGRPVYQRLCALPDDRSLPLPDIMLAQKLALEANEEGFHRVAHRL